MRVGERLYLLDEFSFLLLEGSSVALLVVLKLPRERLLLLQRCLPVLLSQGSQLRNEVLFLLLELSSLAQFELGNLIPVPLLLGFELLAIPSIEPLKLICLLAQLS